jgi:hypothetical protein
MRFFAFAAGEVLTLLGCRRISAGYTGSVMTEELAKLVEAARRRPFPEEEREAQRRSFAYGNAKIENDLVTWEMIVEADEQIKADLAVAK